jgi:hypothetical protein
MKKASFIFLVIVCGGTLCAEPLVDIPPSQKRSATVNFAKTVLAPVAPVEAVDIATLKNPFDPATPPPPQSSDNAVAAVSSGDAQLEEIAPKITPSGSIEIGGEALLLFGQKRLKVGDHLPIIFEGKPYELEIVRIQSTSFTLRLNGTEITRPIKSVTKP